METVVAGRCRRRPRLADELDRFVGDVIRRPVGAISGAECDAAVRLTRRALTAAIRLRRYLKSQRARDNAARIENP